MGLEVYGTAKAICHTGKAIAGVVGPMIMCLFICSARFTRTSARLASSCRRGFHTALRYGNTIDDGMDRLHRVGRVVAQDLASAIGKYAGTQTTTSAQAGLDDYAMLRAIVMGAGGEAAHVGNRLMGSQRRSVPELGF